MKTFLGPNLKFLRRMRGLTQGQLAEIVGIKRHKIASYESAIVEPQFAILLVLADALDTEVTDLLSKQMEQNILEVFEEPAKQADSSTPYYSITPEFKSFIESTNNGQKAIDGFKALYATDFLSDGVNDPQLSRMQSDLNQLFDLVKRLLDVNWTFIHSLQDQDRDDAA